MKINVYKPTQDNWYGNYKIIDGENLVLVSFLQLDPENTKWRVCIWGNDNMGMERDFISESVALNIFYQVIGWDNVNKDKLLELQFGSS